VFYIENVANEVVFCENFNPCPKLKFIKKIKELQLLKIIHYFIQILNGVFGFIAFDIEFQLNTCETLQCLVYCILYTNVKL